MPDEVKILLIDPETEICALIASKLEGQGRACLQVSNLAKARDLLKTEPVRVIVSEIRLADGSGLELLDLAGEVNRNVPVIFVTACGNVASAKQAIRKGAYEYFEKPVDLALLAQTVVQALRPQADYAGPERRKMAVVTTAQADPSGRDELTGLASHRFVLERLPVLYGECIRQAVPLTLCLIDIDGFRDLNNRRGFKIGDLLLTEVGHRLRRAIRTNDIAGRYGGDEFLLVLPGVDRRDAEGLIDRIKQNFRQEPWKMMESPWELPLCVGIAELDRDESADPLETLDRAIEAIYHAKLQGPGAVVVWKPKLLRESTFQVQLDPPEQPVPDYESIHIMMWRFRELNRRLNSVTLESMRLLVAAVEARDPYTKHHSVRVASFARHLATELGLPEGQCRIIHSAGLLHDIGKIGIPDAVLTKPSKLTPEEMDLIRQHPIIAVNILEQARFFVSELALVRHHHEWFNGNGYPDHLAGNAIPLGARILQIADATEAMLARRSYKDPYDLDATIHQLRQGTDRQFDPMLVDVAVRMMREGILERLWRKTGGCEQELDILQPAGK